jgi:hypothetical protein
MDEARPPVVRLGPGARRRKDLEKTLDQVWREILDDPVECAKVAEILHIDPSKAKAALPRPPIELESGAAGLTGGEILVLGALWLAKDVFGGAVTDLAKDPIKKYLKTLWTEVLSPAMRRNLSGRHDMGEEKKDVE